MLTVERFTTEDTPTKVEPDARLLVVLDTAGTVEMSFTGRSGPFFPVHQGFRYCGREPVSSLYLRSPAGGGSEITFGFSDDANADLEPTTAQITPARLFEAVDMVDGESQKRTVSIKGAEAVRFRGRADGGLAQAIASTLSSATNFQNADGVAVDPTNGFAFVSTQNGVAVVDISDTDAITFVELFDDGGTMGEVDAIGVDVADNIVIAGDDGNNDVYILSYNASTGSLTKEAQIAAPSSPRGQVFVHADRDLAYFGAGAFWSVDYSTPAAPASDTIADNFYRGISAGDDGDWQFVVDLNELQLWQNTSGNQGDESEVSTLDLQNEFGLGGVASAYGFHVADLDYLVLVVNESGGGQRNTILLIDVSDKNNPVGVDSLRSEDGDFPATNDYSGVAHDPSTNRFYSGDQDGNIRAWTYSATTLERLAANIDVGATVGTGATGGDALAFDNDVVFVARGGDDAFSTVDSDADVVSVTFEYLDPAGEAVDTENPPDMTLKDGAEVEQGFVPEGEDRLKVTVTALADTTLTRLDRYGR